MSTRVVRFTQYATSDLLEALLWIAKRDGVSRAEKITADLHQAARSLSVYSEHGAKVSELESVGIKQYRQIRKHKFRLVYRVDRKSIFVVAVLHEKRNIATVLISRLKQDPE